MHPVETINEIIGSTSHFVQIEEMIKWIEDELPTAIWSISSGQNEAFDLEITFPNHWDEYNEVKYFTGQSLFEIFSQAVLWIHDESNT